MVKGATSGESSSSSSISISIKLCAFARFPFYVPDEKATINPSGHCRRKRMNRCNLAHANELGGDLTTSLARIRIRIQIFTYVEFLQLQELTKLKGNGARQASIAYIEIPVEIK